MSVRRGYTATSFGQVHYRYAGTVGKPVIVLLHQTPSTGAMYEDLMLALAGDYRLFAPDTPGMGMSDPVDGEMTIGALADGIAEFLDEVGIDHCYVFGHHTGAAIAAELAARHTNRFDAVALCGPTLLNEELKARLPDAAKVIPVCEDGSHLVGMWQRIRGKDANLSLPIAQRETLSGVTLGDLYPAAYDAVIEHDIENALRKVSIPVLVFAGTGDVLYQQLDAALALLSDGRKLEIEGAKSFICETHCQEVAGILREFFPREAA